MVDNVSPGATVCSVTACAILGAAIVADDAMTPAMIKVRRVRLVVVRKGVRFQGIGVNQDQRFSRHEEWVYHG
jgi:hypothetical protein